MMLGSTSRFTTSLLLATFFCRAVTVTLRQRDEVDKERPVSKVVRLLKDMGAELQKELDDDKQVHEMLTCWCETNSKEKTEAIELGEETSTQLVSSMDESAAKVAE